ncbi:MAG: FAD-linked oxidase C-terminal domain-containing protein [Veillonellales bacterium]
MDQQIVRKLTAIVGEKHALTEFEDRYCYSFDSTFINAMPDLVLQPGSRDEIAAVCRVAYEHDIPVVTRGAATGLSGGAVPVKGGIVLEMTRLNHIIEINTVNRYAIVEPGIVTQNYLAAVDQAGLFYPPDPASSKMATLGGNISECAGGPHGVKYGITRNYVLGLEVVLADGSIVQTGNLVDGDMSGPDWTMLFCGSEGTLGVITKIMLKLTQKPQAKQTMMAIFDRIEDAATTVSTMMASGVIPTTLEIMDNSTIRAVENFLNIGLPVEAGAILLIEVDGDPKAVEKHVQHVMKVCQDCKALTVKAAKTTKEADALWKARRSVSPACGKINPTKISEDATVPRSRIPEMVAAVREIAEKYRLKMVIFGHAGDGNLHPNILSNKHDKEEMARVSKAVEELFQAALKLGGTLSGEHGIGYLKAPFLVWELGEEGFQFGKDVKQAVDPKCLLNPGKMFDYRAS